jgi:hypothetical protein
VRRRVGAWLGGLLAAGAAWGGEWTAGPLIHSFPLTLEPGVGLEAAGPFHYRHGMEDGTLWAVPPLVSVYASADGDRGDVHVLPPLFAWHRWGADRKWQLLQWLSGSNVDAIEAPDTKRFQLFPFVFWQDSPDDTRDYRALFPIYGRVKGRLFRDEAEFLLFPLWLESRKGSVRTRNVLFPFLHLRDGPGMLGWQFFPLVGHERLESGTRTNLSDEVVVTPGHDKTFALWPIWFRNRVGLGTTNEGRVDAVLPLWYAERTPARDHTSVMWPFGSVTDDRAVAAGRLRAWAGQDPGPGVAIVQRGADPDLGGADLPLAVVPAAAHAHAGLRPGPVAVGGGVLHRPHGEEPGDGQDGAADRFLAVFRMVPGRGREGAVAGAGVGGGLRAGDGRPAQLVPAVVGVAGRAGSQAWGVESVGAVEPVPSGWGAGGDKGLAPFRNCPV